MRRPSILIGVIAVLLVAAPARAADRFVGVSAGTLFAADGTLQPGTGPALEALARSGIAVARVDARWDSVEPFGTGIVYPRRWAPTDRIAATLAGRGVHWLPVLGYATEWSTSVPGTDKAAPLDTEAFARYAAGIVARYGPDGDFWRMHPELPQLPVSAVEVWNEPNIAAYWRPAPDPAAYADLYLRARSAVRAVSTGVTVITGGLSAYADPAGFVRAMIDARPALLGSVDAIGLHPYAADAAGVIGGVAALREQLRAVGAGDVPLVVTELGWPLPNQSATAGFALPDPTRAGTFALVADALRSSDCAVSGLAAFTWSSAERDPHEQEDWFGLVHPDGTPSAAGAALAAAAARPASGRVPVCGAAGTGATPLSLALDATADRRPGRTCVRAVVTYRGDPVNRLDVAFRQGAYAVTLDTGDDGAATRCFSRADRVTVRASAGRWATAAPMTV